MKLSQVSAFKEAVEGNDLEVLDKIVEKVRLGLPSALYLTHFFTRAATRLLRLDIFHIVTLIVKEKGFRMEILYSLV